MKKPSTLGEGSCFGDIESNIHEQPKKNGKDEINREVLIDFDQKKWLFFMKTKKVIKTYKKKNPLMGIFHHRLIKSAYLSLFG